MSRWIFVSRLLLGRFSKFKNLNASEFNSKHFYDANLVVKSNLLSKNSQKLQIYIGKNQKNFSDRFFRNEGKRVSGICFGENTDNQVLKFQI